jgi:HSP20 family protein
MFPDFFENSWDKDITNFSPAMDVYQTDDAVVVEMTLPDVDPDKVDIEVSDDVLTISGQNEHQSEVDEKNYYRREIRRGAFQRSISLPAHVNGDEAKAIYENGVLKISVPKEERKSSKKIKVTKSDK